MQEENFVWPGNGKSDSNENAWTNDFKRNEICLGGVKMNRVQLQEIVKGQYGRKIAYTSAESITRDNVVEVIGKCIGVFYWNKSVIK